jgi:hypothetical protein
MSQLLDRIGKWEGQVGVAHVVVVVTAIQPIEGSVALAAGNGDRDRGIRVFAAVREVAAARVGGAAGVLHQLGHLASVKRHLGHRVAIDCLFEGDVLGLQRECLASDLDFFGGGADNHLDVDCNIAANLKDVMGLGERFKARRGDGHRINSDRDVGEYIKAGGISLAG